MMIYSSNIFVVIDPTSDNKAVLDRVGKLTDSACSYVHYFLSDYPDKSQINKSFSMKDAKYKFQKEKLVWLKQITKPLEKDTIKNSYELYWNKDWHEAIPHAAVRRGSNLIIKATFAHSKSARTFNKTSDWMLIKRCVSPILFVQEDKAWESGVIIAAVNLEAQDEEHTRLNIAVVQRAKTLAMMTDHKVVLVSAVSGNVDYESYIEDQENPEGSNEAIIGRYFNIEPENVILSEAKPKDAIIEASDKLNADMVVVGSVGRTGISGAIIGNTAEKILDDVKSDVLVVT